MTKGRTITLNKFMFDDSIHLMSEYKDAMENGVFVKGSNHSNIISHEVGHIIAHKKKSLCNKILTTLNREASNESLTLDQYITSKISSYATVKDEDSNYVEIVAEVNSLLTLDENNVIIELLKKAGAI